MKIFLEKHILFPKKYGIQPYIWLIFLTPTIVGLLRYSYWEQILGISLILLFLKAFRDGYVGETSYLTLSFIIQMTVSLILAVNPWFQTWGIQIFTGFSMGFWNISAKRFRVFLLIYYGVAALCYIEPLVKFGFQGINKSSIVTIFLVAVFILISPIFSKLMSHNDIMTEENKALEFRVRQLERERIAYDLHDNLGQTFSTISLQAELASKLIDKKPDMAKIELEKIADNAHESLMLVREIVSDLKSDSLTEIISDKERALNLAGITLIVIGDRTNFYTPFDVILKEALTNVIRHSKASRVAVKFEETDYHYKMTISDNGIGLRNAQPSHGIMGIKKRIKESGGELFIDSDNGTTIVIKLNKDTFI
ncbi:histidine kinase [Lactococcus lactis]|uniref:sensor histidine kinase n=1 Tax=Lactococcus lactis TaxID=1358 RepID=UPI00111108D9